MKENLFAQSMKKPAFEFSVRKKNGNKHKPRTEAKELIV